MINVTIYLVFDLFIYFTLICFIDYYYDYYHTLCECFFMLALFGGISLKFEWQEVPLSPQDSFGYSNWSLQRCSLNSFDSSSNFQLFWSSFKFFGDRSKSANYNRYHRHSQYSIVFPVLWQGVSTFLFSHSFISSLCATGIAISMIGQDIYSKHV